MHTALGFLDRFESCSDHFTFCFLRDSAHLFNSVFHGHRGQVNQGGAAHLVVNVINGISFQLGYGYRTVNCHELVPFGEVSIDRH